MSEAQTEKAFQKQPTVFQGALGTKKGGRYIRDVGMGFKTPQEAIEGNFIDKKCPFTGNVSIRGRVLRGVVRSVKMKRTVIVRRDYLRYLPKYKRYEKRHRNIPVHVSPAFRPQPGDMMTFGECRPLSKTVSFNCLELASKEGMKKFAL
eukprot:TRINITY_DN2704_c0_g1_i1.p1 TRINITY_DN2704_c0_g1~~TRINITY_DN2704_c0_g1_i1.p1  ORF type:complete len:164 (-),score=22.83 TRINITY_DN2704_c0_g1_i1:37-483(-)